MKATKSGNFNPVTLPEPQTAIARCYSVVDVGKIEEVYKGEAKGPKRKIHITWEFPTLLAKFNEEKGEEPFVVGYECTASTGDNSNFAKLIAQWRGKPLTPAEQEGFDPSTMVGKTGYISFQIKRRRDFVDKEIVKATNENSSLKFIGIMAKPKDVECPPNRNAYYVWDWDLVEKDGFEAHKANFEKMPKWLQKKASESMEFKKFCGSYKVDSDDNSQPANKPEASKVSKEDW
jgi:hypothetical protein